MGPEAVVADDVRGFREVVSRAVMETRFTETVEAATLDELTEELKDVSDLKVAVLDRKLGPDRDIPNKVDELALLLKSRGVKDVILLTAYRPRGEMMKLLKDAGVVVIIKNTSWEEQLIEALGGESGASKLAEEGVGDVEDQLSLEFRGMLLQFLRRLERQSEKLLVWGGTELSVDDAMKEVEEGTALGKDLLKFFTRSIRLELGLL